MKQPVDLIRELYRLEEQKASILKEIEDAKTQVQIIFDKKDLSQIVVPGDDKFPTLVANKVEKANINYFLDKLKAKLDPDLCNEFIEKRYSVPSMGKLIKLMKEYGVHPKEFKPLIEVNESIDKDKLKQLYAVGDITIKEMKGCYEAKISKYITVKVKRSDGE